MRKAKFYHNNPQAPKPNKPNHVGASMIVVHNKQILMEYRSDSDYWALIGGGLFIDESIEDCAIRELKEETGMDIQRDMLQFFNLYTDPTRIIEYPDGNVIRCITVTFIVHINYDHDLRCSHESRELRYFDIDELSGLDIVETHQHIIADYMNSLSC